MAIPVYMPWLISWTVCSPYLPTLNHFSVLDVMEGLSEFLCLLANYAISQCEIIPSTLCNSTWEQTKYECLRCEITTGVSAHKQGRSIFWCLMWRKKRVTFGKVEAKVNDFCTVCSPHLLTSNCFSVLENVMEGLSEILCLLANYAISSQLCNSTWEQPKYEFVFNVKLQQM